MKSKKKTLLTGEQRDDLRETTKNLNEGWRKQTKSILEFSRALLAAREKFPDHKDELIKGLDFERAVFDKLCRIGECTWLHKPQYLKYLPASYSSIWEYTKLTEAEFEAKAKAGAIRPKLKRSEIQTLVPSKTAKKVTAKDTSLRITVDWSLPEYRKSEFQKWLRDGEARFPGIRVNWDDFSPSVVPPQNPNASDDGSDELFEAEEEAIEEARTGNVADFTVAEEAEMKALYTEADSEPTESVSIDVAQTDTDKRDVS